MDPNETLKNIRELAEAIFEDESQESKGDKAEELADYFQALDEWISNGGCLPLEWAH